MHFYTVSYGFKALEESPEAALAAQEPQTAQRPPEGRFRPLFGGPPRSWKLRPGSALGGPRAQNGPRGPQRCVLEPFLEGPPEARNLP